MAEQTTTDSRQFTITRVFDAPRELVWQAWTDPDEAAIWWHPKGIETPRESVHIEAEVGGAYRYTMIAPDGTEYPTVGTFHEITRPERIVMTWGSPGDAEDAVPVLTIDLAEHGDALDKTLMTFTVQGIDGSPGDENVYDGWDQAFDLLADHLPDLAA